MKKIITCMFLSLFLMVGSVEVFADNHGDRGKDRKEQRDNRRGGRNENRDNGKNNRRGAPNNSHGNKGNDKKEKDYRPGKQHNDLRPGKGHSMPAPGHGMGRPAPAPVRHHTPPPPPRPRHYAPAPPPPPRLSHMVRYATRGCRDVAVWQIDYDTYIVKYRRGNRYYTQYLYPYADRYGDRSLITVNWEPLSPWTLIPPIQLNINL